MMHRIPRYIFLTLLFILIFGLFSAEIRDPDFWWHLKTGEYICQKGALPETDPFAYTSLQKDPVNPESERIRFILTQYWLAQVLFSQTYALFSFQGIIYLRAAILALLMFLIYRAIRREGIGVALSLVFLVPAVMLFHTFMGERPQLFSFLFSFLLIFLLEGFRRAAAVSTGPAQSREPLNLNGSQRVSFFFRHFRISVLFYLAPIPFIMLMWANMHGGFILGIVILLAYLLSESLKLFSKKLGPSLPARAYKFLIVTGVTAILASLINPNTYKVIPFLFELESGSYKGMIIEAMSPVALIRAGFYEPQFMIYFFLLALGFLLLLLHLSKFDLTDAALFTGFAFMSLYASRLIPFFVPLALLLTARYAPGILRRPLQNKLFVKMKAMGEKAALPATIILSVALVILINNADLFKNGIRANKYPQGAANFLKAHRISGNMFNPYVWGGYLIWELYPDYRVFLDGRGLIGEVFFQEVRILEASPKKFEGIPEWKAMLNAYNVDFILTFSVGNFTGRLVPLIPALLNDPEWHLVFMDNISLIFVKQSPANEELIQRFGMPKEWLWNEVAVEAGLKAQDYGWNVNYYLTMGEALLASRNYPNAKRAFAKALEKDPGNDIARKRLDLLHSYGY